MKIAALFVERTGPYAIECVDVYDESRDARQYLGPYPVVAHPPCQRWGRYAEGGPNPRARRYQIGDDNGCFESALRSVRSFGGILEHPEASHAWEHFGIARPPKTGGWIRADAHGGYTCCVAQGHYGHAAQKFTWLFAVRTLTPDLIWGACVGKQRLDLGPASKAHAIAMRAAGLGKIDRLSRDQRIHTPTAFRDLLIRIAQTAYFVR